MAAGAAAARALEGVTECAPHPDHAPSHACVCARDTGACNMPGVQQRRCLRRTLRECSREMPDGDGAGGGSSEAGRVLVAASRKGSASAAMKRSRQKNRGQRQAMARFDRRPAADEASGSYADWRERKGSDFCVGNDCGKGPLARAGHLGERDAAPTGLEFLGRGTYVSLFLSPNPPLSIYSLRSLAVL
jgi:hypothetical protein